MPIISVKKDAARLTMTVIGEYPVSVQRLWDAYADARQIERFWGPPTWPATFTRHDMKVGGRSEYFMTGPDGKRSSGYWTFLAVDPPRGFEVQDGFAKADGSADPDLPSMNMRYTFEATDAGARFTCVTTFPSAAALEELLKMGMEEGMRAALDQLDGFLASAPGS